MSKELILPNRFKNQVATGDQCNKAVAQITAGDLKKMRVQIAADIEKEIRRSLEGERAAMVRESLIGLGWIPPELNPLITRIIEMKPITDDHNEELSVWCVFCQAEAGEEKDVIHNDDCVWINLCRDWKAKK